jgi:hypothetical protein
MKRIASRRHVRMVAVAAAALAVPLVVVGLVGTGASGERRSPDAAATPAEAAAASEASQASQAGEVAAPAGPAQEAAPEAFSRGPRCWTRPEARWCKPSAEAPTTTTTALAAGEDEGGAAAPAARAHGYRPGAYPNPATTGVPDGWTPRSTHNGDLTVTTPGTVIEDTLITGDLQVRATGVTVRRTRVLGIIWNQYSDTEQFGGLLIEDVEVGPDSGVKDWGHGAVGTAGYTARRVEIHNVTDGFRVSGDNIVIEDSFVKLAAIAGECNHLDGVQGYGGGTNVVVTHNTFDARGSCGNAAVFFADSSPHADVEDNILLGGAYSLRLQQAEVPATFIAIDNRIVQNSYDSGPLYIFDSGSLNLTCSGNQVVTIDDNYQISGVVGEAPCNRTRG